MCKKRVLRFPPFETFFGIDEPEDSEDSHEDSEIELGLEDGQEDVGGYNL